MKKNIFFTFFTIVAIVLFIFFLVYLSNNLLNQETRVVIGNAPIIRGIPEYAPSDAFGIGTSRSMDASIPIFPTQYINDSNFSGYFSFMNNYDKSNQYLIMALLDNKVISFKLNDDLDSMHLINISPHKAYVYSLNITGIPSGYHDLTILSFQNPYDNFTNISFYDASNKLTTAEIWKDNTDVCTVRYNIINNNSSRPIIEWYDPEINSLINNSLKNVDGLWITKEPFSNEIMEWDNFTRNDTVNYCINVANNQTDNMSFAIVQILDYKQIPLNTNDQNNVYYGNLTLGESLSIPASLNATFEKGMHKLIIIMVTDPYKNIEISPGVLNPEMKVTIASGSVGINII